ILEPQSAGADAAGLRDRRIRTRLGEGNAAVGDADLNERAVAGDRKVVTPAQTELDRRRIGAGGADRPEWVGDRRARGVAVFRERLAEIDASGNVVDQH